MPMGNTGHAMHQLGAATDSRTGRQRRTQRRSTRCAYRESQPRHRSDNQRALPHIELPNSCRPRQECDQRGKRELVSRMRQCGMQSVQSLLCRPSPDAKPARALAPQAPIKLCKDRRRQAFREHRGATRGGAIALRPGGDPQMDDITQRLVQQFE